MLQNNLQLKYYLDFSCSSFLDIRKYLKNSYVDQQMAVDGI